MRFNHLDQRSVGIFEIAKSTSCLSHIKTVLTVYCEIKPFGLGQTFQLIQSIDIQTTMDEAQISPISILKKEPWKDGAATLVLYLIRVELMCLI